ncbi:MAG: hypothetical protein IPM13_10195 [Phycisphaerales bacterium]|nr:hypothetical protein [Phycisphaerales bacterium]
MFEGGDSVTADVTALCNETCWKIGGPDTACPGAEISVVAQFKYYECGDAAEWEFENLPPGSRVTTKNAGCCQGEWHIATAKIMLGSELPRDGRFTAKATRFGCSTKPHQVRVGYGRCSTGNCGPGSFDGRPGSMEGTWSLGMLADGESAGSIEWRLDDDDLERFGVYFPLTLLLRATVEGSNPAVTVVRDSNGGLLQVLTPSVFADIRELESLPPKLSIKFFSSAAAIGGSPFGVDQDAIPFAVWTIEQLPEGSNDADFRVTQYESAGAGGDGALGAILTSYVYSVLLNVQQGTSTWTLATYDGDIGPSETPLRVEVLSKENGGLAKHRKIYEGNALVTDVTETSSTYSWGAAVTSHTQYTGVGDPLVTSYQYYANPIRPGAELASVIRPDGSWRAYTYEIDSQSDDYIMIVYSGWLDEPLPTSLGSPAECENCLATVHRYRASDGREVSTTEYAAR